jgi:hypothetical protein
MNKNSKNKYDNSRRNFIKTSLLVASGMFVTPGLGEESNNFINRKKTSKKISCIDYGRSFLCNTSENNSVRMWIESRTTIFDLKSGIKNEYYQGASCKSENTFGEKDLFYKDNYDFLPVFGDGKVLIFRRFIQKLGEGYRSINNMEDIWGKNPIIYLPLPKEITVLDTWEKIRDATAAGIPIVTQTEFEDTNTGLRAIIECPCKTMNISLIKQKYQVDTGPVAFPDLSKKYENQIDCINLAFLAFNTSNFTDFVLEVPTPLLNEQNEVATVYHYSKMVSVQSVNRILALGKL